MCSIDGKMRGEMTLGEKSVSVPIGPPQILQGMWCLSIQMSRNKKKRKAASNGITCIPSFVKIDHLDKQTQAKLLFFSPQMREVGLKNIPN